MVLNVGINGFGRIGRIAFRASLQHEDIRVTAINDPAIDVEYFNYLLKYDSTHGKFKGQLEIKENQILVNGSSINIYQHKNPSSIPWQNTGVQYVIESSGVFTTQEKAAGHLGDGVKRIIVTAPSVDVPMIILGVNDNTLTDAKIISCASSSLYCLAPIMQVLEQNFGVVEGFVTSIHAMTPSLKPLDSVCVRGKHWRDHRSIHQNIIPAATGVCKALSKVLPQLRDKLSGIAFRVPVVDVSLLDISVRLKTATNLEEILKRLENAKQTYMKNIINIAKEEVVSSDFIEDSNSCTIDISSSLQLKPNFYKIICWYENEYSYACRIFDTIHYCEQHLGNTQIDPNLYKNKTHTVIRNSCESYPNEKHKYYAMEKQKSNRDTKGSFTNYNSLTVIPIQIKNIVKDNISILFKSQPKNNKQASKASEEKVEKLKEEVTKCVDITEKLLKDSRRNRLTFKSTVSHLVNREISGKSKENNENRSVTNNDYCNIKSIQTLEATTDNNSYNYDKHTKSKSTLNNTKYEEILKKYEVTKLSDKILKMSKNTKPISNNINTEVPNEIRPDSSRTAILKFKNEYFDKKYYSENNPTDAQIKQDDKQVPSPQRMNHERHFIQKDINTLNSNNLILPDTTNIDNNIQNKNVVVLELKEKSDKEHTELEVTVENFNNEVTKDICNTEQDIILDKLDSISGSGSNNSFGMNQRKSEIISIQDISKSLEDLTKLEQICKIIDISDDLSDKLFSPLNTSSHRNSDRSSLKELCNKIHLDEFYDNVFCSCDDE